MLYFSDFSTRQFRDAEFGQAIAWDTPLLGGYRHQFVNGGAKEQTGIGMFSPRVSGLAKQLTSDNFDVVVVQGWNHYGMVLASWLAKRAGLRVFLRCEATDHFVSSSGIRHFLREQVVQFLLTKIDRCLAIGSHNRNFYINRGFPADKIFFSPYCVDNEYFKDKSSSADLDAMRQEFDLRPGHPILLFVGKFTARKFPDLLLKAYVKLPEPRPYLLFVGDGELRQRLELTSKTASLSAVRFVGFRNQGELPRFYALADIFVLPSVMETWGLVVNEAMNAGCAIVTTDQVGCAKDLVEDGYNGFVVTPYDANALSCALEACLANHDFRRMGNNSARRISYWGIPENIDGLRSAVLSFNL